MIDNGKLSTYAIGILVLIQGYLISNPEIINTYLTQYGLIQYAPLILSIIVYTYDYFNPRNPTPQE